MTLFLFQEDSGLAQGLGSIVVFVIVLVLLFKLPFIDRIATPEEPYIGLKYVGLFALVAVMIVAASLLTGLILGIPL